MATSNQNAEQRARDQIDAKLAEAGWIVQHRTAINFNAGSGIAVREYQTDVGPADYVLFLDKRAIAVIEAKPEEWGHKITAVEDQSAGYAAAKLKWVSNKEPLPFIYESTKPWESAGMPFNPTTDKGYRGGNAVHLMATGLSRGYEDPRWMTYKQAAENGWQVRKGEKGTHIEFWEVKAKREEKSAEPVRGGRDETAKENQSRLIHRVYTVFNAKQVEGVPALEREQPSVFEAVHSGERILANSGAKIAHDQRDSAFYSRSSDSIHLPLKETFKDAPGYYGTALHELAHWTGHPSRLNRPTLNDSYRFGDLNYAKEELRAELASVFIAAEVGVPHDPANHAAYVGSWIKALKEDKNEIFRAAHDASTATDFVLSLEREVSRAEALEAGNPAATDIDKA